MAGIDLDSCILCMASIALKCPCDNACAEKKKLMVTLPPKDSEAKQVFTDIGLD